MQHKYNSWIKKDSITILILNEKIRSYFKKIWLVSLIDINGLIVPTTIK